ncbi:hypothetical protein DENIS_0056 [Desulfonema ishimotonii]|uniref:General secretion pathway protein GspM n=1 Tax=Desulfonema ishimotonii TaxID=45657 RepID=A0A401FQ87_9BACT|nr:type 4a pilus biogenesis protein PilO [Desulfonema ishimotonii]GBC59120.1 hypothetical protein DENIS_0056 [Desulfonema ishimotonii]
MDRRPFLYISSKYYVYYALGVSGIIAFVAAFIVPDYRDLVKKNKQIEALNIKIKHQELLFPVYETHLKEINILKKIENQYLGGHGKMSPGQDDADKIPEDITRIALLNNFQIRSVQTDIRASDNSTPSLEINIAVVGVFPEFRNFFIQLNELPYIEFTQYIQIRSAEQAEEFHLKVWASRK